jgi:hypothetical protein
MRGLGVIETAAELQIPDELQELYVQTNYDDTGLGRIVHDLIERIGRTEMELRRLMWLGHGHFLMYGDDGEMQCGECAKYGMYDYKREPMDKIRRTYQIACLATNPGFFVKKGE